MPRKRANNEGTIGLYGGRWVARITLPSGQRKAFYGSTHDEVRRKLTSALRDLGTGMPPPTSDRISVGAYLTSWLMSKSSQTRPATQRAYESHVRLYFLPAFGNVRLTQLTARHGEALMREQLNRGLSPSSVRRIRATLRSALSSAQRQGLVNRNVAALARE
jgi:integrase